jgi:membrane-bound lytic murein transglycosylase A
VRHSLWATLALAGCVVSCVQPPPKVTPVVDAGPVLTRTSYDKLPGWNGDGTARAVGPFLAGCAHMADARINGEAKLGGTAVAEALGGKATSWQPACDAARGVADGDDAAARLFFETWLVPYAVTSGAAATGLFTGYYEPEIKGSRSPGSAYKVALLSRPADLVPVEQGVFTGENAAFRAGRRLPSGEVVPFYDRAEIDHGALAGKRLELIWLTDPIDAFFLHIQGAGRIRLPDGKVARVSYAGQNGRTYVPIGRVLVDRGEMTIEQVSMQSIREWLRAHPTEAAEVMAKNPSYVFFREIIGVKTDQGPPGTLGVPMTPGRSLAVDRSVIPLGAPVWLDTTDPVDGAKLQRLMLAQDTGGAIHGAVRADVFWGWGAEAEDKAGRMRQQGRYFVLLPKE